MLRNPSTPLSTDPRHAAVCAHFVQHGEALLNAASLLEGPAGEARVLRIMSDIRTTAKLERAARRQLVNLHRTLTLNSNLGDPEMDTAPWQFLDPESREVEEICLLADRLFDLLVEIGEMDEEKDALALYFHRWDAA